MNYILELANDEITFEKFCKRAQFVFLLSEKEAVQLSKYIFEIKQNDEPMDEKLTVKSNLVQFKLDSFIGNYISCTDEVIDNIIHEFISLFKPSNILVKFKIVGDDENKNKFI